MKLTFAILLLTPFLSHAFNLKYSCKSNEITGTYDYYVIDLSARTLEARSLYNNKVTRKGLVATNISFEVVTSIKNNSRSEQIE